jgi:Ca2+-binding RTX toxin-like protein
MTKHFIPNQTSTFLINDSNDTWMLSKDATISVTQNSNGGILEDDDYGKNRIIVNGSITVVEDNAFPVLAGVSSGGESSEIIVGKGGMITAEYRGISASGDHASITNNGRVVSDDHGTGTSTGIEARGIDTAITNTGLVKSIRDGIATQGADTTLMNAEGARVIAGGIAVYAQSSSEGNYGNNFELTNHGLIKGGEFSILNEDLASRIVNRGVLKGDVSLGDGTDVFDTRGGKLFGTAFGGAGDDTYFTSTADVAFSENVDEGFDTVRASTSFKLGNFMEKLVLIGKADINGAGDLFSNTIVGNAGDNILKGFGGTDVLQGGLGNDRLVGGADADTFVFKTGFGHDVIKGLSASEDHVDLRGWNAIANLADLEKNHLDVSGDDLVISAGSDQLVLKGVDKADLDNIDFMF